MKIEQVKPGWFKITIKTRKKTFTTFAFSRSVAVAKAKKLLGRLWNEDHKKIESDFIAAEADGR